MSSLDEYYNIKEGNYCCQPYAIVNDGNKIVFLVIYQERDINKRISVNYIFTDKSFNITFMEIVTLLETAGMPIDSYIMNKLYNKDLVELTSMCNLYLLNKKLRLEVSINKRNFKQLRLYYGY